MAGGRKLEFDKRQALDAAMRVFWKKGFLGASLTDLTEGMGINKPSMYATFGNKETLFIQATEYYQEEIGRSHNWYLYQADKPLRQRLKDYLMSVVATQCDKNNPKGCYISLCVSEAAGDGIPEKALATIANAAGEMQTTLLTLFQEDPAARQLLINADAEEVVRFLITLLNGTAAMARAGKKLSELEPVVNCALKGVGL